MSNEKPKFGFKTTFATAAKPTDPEALFNSLKDRSPKIQALWAHQADVLRAYAKGHATASDVALQLPTGSGKTLVGLLIAEYRRRALDHRVLYLCPNRQLVHQVHAQAQSYGIAASACVPSEYQGIGEYQQSQIVAISTYSALFNTNPRFNDPQTIILDDAHSAEDYITKLWAVEISRKDYSALYTALVNLLTPLLDSTFISGLLDSSPSPDIQSNVEMLPHPMLLENEKAIEDLIAEHLPDKDEQSYPFSKIRGYIRSCSLFVSWSSILLRPLIPPTSSHRPFAGAKQRVFMSATLGDAGELERLAGVPRIARIPAPEGWEQGTSGRRLFLMPNAGLKEPEALQVALDAVASVDRALVLTSRFSAADEIAGLLAKQGVKTLLPKDVESSLDAFKKSTGTALILANRYDGLDLPGDDCRLLIFYGLPAGTNLVERFMLSRMNAGVLLRDRIRTRLTQGIGRCCRGATDYAAVILIGSKLLDFCAKRDIRQGLHTELQAELDFGLTNSQKLPADGFAALLALFLNRGDEWREAEQAILGLTAGKKRETEALSKSLAEVATAEVEFSYALWQNDYAQAKAKARAVSDKLGGVELMPYRAFWHYLEGVAAWYEGKASNSATSLQHAKDCFVTAGRCSRFISWFSRLASRLQLPAGTQTINELDALSVERLLNWLERVGLHGKEFERRMAEMTAQLGKKESTPFEMGLEALGTALGIDAVRPNVDGAPDGVWKFSPKNFLAIEAKSDETPSDSVSLSTVRQANGHAQWVRTNMKPDSDATILTVVVTPRRTLSREAQPHCGDLRYMSVADIQSMAGRAAAAVRGARSQFTSQLGEEAGDIVFKQLEAQKATASAIAAELTKTQLAELKVP